MEIKFSKLSLPSSGVAIIAVTKEQKNLDHLKKFVVKSPTDFQADFAELIPASHPEEHNLDLIILMGLGSSKELNEEKARKLGGKLCAYLSGLKITKASIILDTLENTEIKTCKVATELALGASLRNYKFDKYITVDKEKKNKNQVTQLDFRLEEAESASTAFIPEKAILSSVKFARDLISEPANVLTPEHYAKLCSKNAPDGLKVEIIGQKEMSKLGMHSLLGVAQGSVNEPKLVTMQWHGSEDKDKTPIAFVGKGVCFDTGGISLKPAGKMDAMKADMGGSAAVVGAMFSLAKRNAKVNAIGVIGLVENMPDGNAQRPGDIVKSMSGQTIEVLNTDAEGRLVLADALHYTNTQFKPEIIVDLATLTGAVVVSLADVYAGLFANDQDLADKLIKSGQSSDEWLWQFPLHEEFDAMINSPIADMQNIGNGRGAGSITAAQFLKRFVGETKWAHLDIAGVSAIDRNKDLAPKGATAFGVRLLDRFVQDHYEEK